MLKYYNDDIRYCIVEVEGMFGFIGNIGPWELIFILLIALIVVGPGKLPEVAKSIGKASREFKKATSGVKKEIDEAMRFDDEPQNTVKINKNTEEVQVKEENNEKVSPDELNSMVSSPGNSNEKEKSNA
jgi:sec-independent protein translocase protein TatA